MFRWVPDSGEIAETFADQGEAEAWFSASFEDLADQGITEVSLYEDDELVYGPMGIDPV